VVVIFLSLIVGIPTEFNFLWIGGIMALIEVDLVSTLRPANVTIDQSNYEDGALVKVGGVAARTLNITNTSSVDESLIIQESLVGLALVGTTTYNLGEDVSVKHEGGLIGLEVASTTNFNLSKGATLELSNDFLSVGLLNTVNIDMGSDASSTLIYDPAGINVELSALPNLTGVSVGDQIQVVGATGVSYENGNLIFSGKSGLPIAAFNAPGLNVDDIQFENGMVSYACFLKGTHMTTPEGQTKVEDLKAGDKLVTASGGVASVKWVGYRKLYKSRIPAADAVRAFPILIKKDAIADNVPHADLTVSPGHHLYFDGLLIPAMMLVNGQTITQQFETRSFEYYHVELEEFDILLAENVPAESYVDTGNRSMFQNAKEVDLNPDFGPAEGRPEVEGITVVREGAQVEAVRKQLLARAEQMTGARRTKDAELRIEVDGQVIEATPEFVKEGVYSFELPANAGDIRILSRSATVRDVTPLARRDIRQIGVGLSAIAIVDAQGRRELALTDGSIAGLNKAQDVKGTPMSWTTGEAVVPASVHQASTAKTTLELSVLRTYTYWMDDVAEKAVEVA
jgi:hypothetical protein